MTHIYLLFEDPLINSKILNISNKFQPDWEVESLLDIRQVPSEITCEDSMIITNEHIVSQEHLAPLLTKYKYIVFIQENEPEIPKNKQIQYINSKFLLTGIGSFYEQITLDKHKSSTYVPVNFKKIKPNVIYPVDIFLKLSAEKYIKVVNKDNSFDDSLFEKLKKKEIQFVYVDKKYLPTINKLLYAQTGKAALFKEEHIVEELNAVESLHRYINDLGVDEKIINLTKGLHGNLEQKYNQKFMKNLFKRFESMEGSFLYNHSYVTSVIALAVGKKFKWMTPENNEKIYLGCMLHDLGYKDKKHAMYEHLTKIEIDKKEKSVADDILNHPIVFAQKLAQLDNIHQDVIKIVRDHHGVHEQGSYPKVIYPAEINLIFALFILSHEFTIGLFKVNFNPTKIEQVINEIHERFDKGAYRKILKEFSETVREIF